MTWLQAGSIPLAPAVPMRGSRRVAESAVPCTAESLKRNPAVGSAAYRAACSLGVDLSRRSPRHSASCLRPFHETQAAGFGLTQIFDRMLPQHTGPSGQYEPDDEVEILDMSRSSRHAPSRR